MTHKRTARPGSRWVVGVLLAIAFLDELFDGFWGAAWPLVRDDLALSYGEIGLLMSVPTLISIALEPPLGVLADAGWRRPIALGGGVAYTAALLLLVAAPGFTALLAGMSLFYVASGAFVNLSQATLIDLAPERSEALMARWVLVGSVAMTAGPLWLAAAEWLGLGWRSGCAALAAVTLALTGLAARTPALRSDAGGEPAPPLAEAAREALEALRRGAVLRWLVMLQLAELLLTVFPGFVALYLVDVVGLTPTQTGWALALATAAGLGGDALLLPALERVSGLTWVRVTAAVASLALVALVAAPNLVPLKVGLLALLYASCAGWYAILKGRLYEELPGRSGTVIATTTLFSVVGIGAPVAIGAVASAAGLEVALGLLAVGPAALAITLPREGA